MKSQEGIDNENDRSSAQTINKTLSRAVGVTEIILFTCV